VFALIYSYYHQTDFEIASVKQSMLVRKNKTGKAPPEIKIGAVVDSELSQNIKSTLERYTIHKSPW
jgi:hypothetical protein